jgi:hypothetical protein
MAAAYQNPVTMPLGSQFAPPDRAAQAQDSESREAQDTGEFRRPDGGLQRHRSVIACKRRYRGKAVAQVDGAYIKDELRIHT